MNLKASCKKAIAFLLACIMLIATPLNVEAASKTLKTLKGSKNSKLTEVPSYTKDELRLMSSIIFCEAGAESYSGKLAVGIVIMNRVHSKLFPNTISGVVYEKGQFSPVRSGKLASVLKLYDRGKFTQKNHVDSIKAAREVLDGRTTVTKKGKKVSMKSYLFFSVYLKNCKFKLGNHMFR